MAKEMLKGTQELGLVGLAIHEGGLRKPFAKAAADRALLLEAQEDPRPAVERARDGHQVPGRLPDVDGDQRRLQDALSSGTIDGMEANLGLIWTNQLYEVAKYVTGNVTLWPYPTVLTINKGKYTALSAGQRKVLRDAAAGLAAYSLKIFTNPAPTALNFTKLLCEEGVKFVTASDDEVEELLRESRPPTT